MTTIMKRIITLTMVFSFLSVLAGCAGQEVSFTPEPENGSTSEETPVSQQVPTKIPEKGLEPSPESPAKAETVVETEKELELSPESPAKAETVVKTKMAEVTAKESSPNTGGFKPAEPVLLEGLSKNCQSTGDSENFNNAGLSIGQVAVNFTLKDTQGTEFRLSRLLAENPVVIVFGSFT
jgi:hypothetical protein